MKYQKPRNKINVEIKNTINETIQENNKLEQLKKSLYLTKTKELNIESNLYSEQINKINKLIENALQIKELNDNKEGEFESLQQNIERQNIIIDNLTRENIALESQQDFLNNKLEKLQSDVKAKIEKAKKNDNELNILSIKNKNLSNDKIIQKQIYTTKKDGLPISVKSLYTGKVSSLKKSINFYKKQIKYSDDVLNKLKERLQPVYNSFDKLAKYIRKQVVKAFRNIPWGFVTYQIKTVNKALKSIPGFLTPIINRVNHVFKVLRKYNLKSLRYILNAIGNSIKFIGKIINPIERGLRSNALPFISKEIASTSKRIYKFTRRLTISRESIRNLNKIIKYKIIKYILLE